MIVLLDNLPDDSATARALGNGWRIADFVLAGIFDVLQVANWQRSGGKGRRPKPLPRPGTGPKTETLTGGSYDLAELQALLDEQNPDVRRTARQPDA